MSASDRPWTAAELMFGRRSGRHSHPATHPRWLEFSDVDCPACGGMPPVTTLNSLGAIWSPDFDAYASGQLDASRVRCVLCGHAPCDCPEFGTPEYFDLIDRLHSRNHGGAQ